MPLTIEQLEALRVRAYREEGYLVFDDLVPNASWKTIQLMNRFTELVGVAIVEDLEAQADTERAAKKEGSAEQQTGFASHRFSTSEDEA